MMDDETTMDMAADIEVEDAESDEDVLAAKPKTGSGIIDGTSNT
jgi:hypothetical protein